MAKIEHDELKVAEEIKVILTFDDGPAIEAGNYTDKILNTLRCNPVQNNISAIFFVQTHVPYRGGCPQGAALLERALAQGHRLEIHTGSVEDHEDHIIRASKTTTTENNQLETDIVRASQYLSSLDQGFPPQIVRPPWNRYDDNVMAIYRKHLLKVLEWDIDSGDSLAKPMSKAQFRAHFRREIDAQLAAGNQEIVILMHDIQAVTAAYLDDFLQVIKAQIESYPGLKALFTSQVSEHKYVQ